ncbi:dual specificity protein phosphatase 1-like isoform X2 [Solanum dulcamara]|uniref:dual specificity protein phosphatase 1-like isoform X2 n=1 Tax=Solanum dulcamara TaxID=45834 RepID=UPI002484E77C|nr:dual specificity protein phosphatase 1-like isoform X2 [Solanum dulcamara]
MLKIICMAPREFCSSGNCNSHTYARKLKQFQGRNQEMAQALEFYSGHIEALMRAMSLAKIIREDKNSCMIEEGLYLGSFGAANNKDALKSLNLTHILTIARDINPPYPNEFVYKVLAVHDRVDVNISHYFEECFDFIEEAKRQGGGVLVHCFAGKSRSATIVIAYLMKKHGMSRSEAFQLVKSKRPVVSPNAGFMTQLENYDKTLKAGRVIKTTEREKNEVQRQFSKLYVAKQCWVCFHFNKHELSRQSNKLPSVTTGACYFCPVKSLTRSSNNKSPKSKI